MALSCYILQNVLASIFFYSWGFGLTGRVGRGRYARDPMFAIFVVLVTFSHLWLQCFSQGPFEAVW